ncbi:Penicillin-binding protein 1A [Streptococcus sanguinis]|uniref:Penicillin-binding protein 1A, putative n=1 Tax=Streptococcus sanguinis (strain SK36) TaxID=388919 RepID=A3CPY6_STRSV|nr:penicillin-binding protein PBP1A [Streptococcus sanguinis]ABN45241.1 Penicillin-binding protein 1A, putative [Streptococcus sanguinis SK36]MBZ2056183.1 penicillin-binding protein PBP1A [Streptococcus sanguinis]MBZ2058392.1 penicillin-binding protein PBP1A [Streptococcus sanguinis]RSI03811.1 Penicillin-binding protein 1A [Streptococcus sanguinis]RSI16954.1 Penicillin-binding protein 1A [Streptococcus sanguinis]
MNKQTLMQALKYLASALITLLMIGFVIGCLVFTYYAVKAPKLSEKDLIATTSSKIFDSNNNLIADLGAEKRVNAETSEIPTDLVNAIVAIEDHRFFNHRGVDFIRIAGALISNIRGGGRQGGSTLTQQLIKLSYFSTSSSDATLSRKIQEAWLAAQLERKATKQQILTYYVNKVYMSNSNYGMQTAARSYYGKDLKDLSLHQTALLAGMPQAPNQYDPYTHPEAATNRRNLVLREMHDLKYITDEQYEQAKNTPVTDGLQSLKASTSYPAYMDNYLKEVIEQVEEETGYNVLTTGMEVYTNVNTDAQKKLWDIYNTGDYVAYPDDEMQVASTVMDVQTGKVIAQLGSRNQSTNVSFGTNQAVETNRDFGSTMKPITDYAPALENEVYTSTAAPITDAPYNFPYSSTPVYNWDKKYYGGMTIQYAIQESRNVPAVKTLEAVGLDESLKFLNRIGINYPEMFYVNAFSSNTSKSGNEYGASSEKMAAAYAAFANGGTYYKPQYVNRVVFSDGTEKTFSNNGSKAMKETTAYMMTDMMKTVLQSGTGTNAAISGVYQAGKTGTSNYADDELAKLTKPYYYSSIVTPDELFVGYTPKYSMAVWTGYSNRLTPILDDGVKVATDVYREMMLYLAQDGSASEDWEMPDGLYRSGSYVYLNSGTGYNRYYNNQQYYNYSSYSSYSTEASSDTSASSEHSGDSNNNSSSHNDSSSGNGGDD